MVKKPLDNPRIQYVSIYKPEKVNVVKINPLKSLHNQAAKRILDFIDKNMESGTTAWFDVDGKCTRQDDSMDPIINEPDVPKKLKEFHHDIPLLYDDNSNDSYNYHDSYDETPLDESDPTIQQDFYGIDLISDTESFPRVPFDQDQYLY